MATANHGFTYYVVSNKPHWLRAEAVEAVKCVWLRLGDIERVTTDELKMGGKVVVHVKGIGYEVPHACATQDALDRAVFDLLETIAKR